MSIDARIIGATTEKNGSCWLSLEPREEGGIAGQVRLSVANPPADGNAIYRLIECEIWGGDGLLMLGNKMIASRLSATVIKLVNGWVEIADEWTASKLNKKSI